MTPFPDDAADDDLAMAADPAAPHGAGDVVRFPDGIPGFEDCRHFALGTPRTPAPLRSLHAIEGQAAAFLALDPRLVLRDYRCLLRSRDRERLDAEEDTALVWLSLITIDPDETAWINLRAPIVINPARLLGYQVIPRNALYPLRYPLLPAR